MTNLLIVPKSNLNPSREKVTEPNKKGVEITEMEHKEEKVLNEMNNNGPMEQCQAVECGCN